MNGPQQNEPLLEVDGISLWFKGVKAVTDVSFQVGTEELYAIIGPNGAGKTTLVRQITTEIIPTSGEILILGYSTLSQSMEIKALLGIMPQEATLFDYLTVYQHLRMLLLHW